MGGLRLGLGVLCTLLFLALVATAGAASTRAASRHGATPGCARLVGKAETCLWRTRVLYVPAHGSYRAVRGYVLRLYRRGRLVRRIRTGRDGTTRTIALAPGRYTVRTGAFTFRGHRFRSVELGRLTSPIFGPSYPGEYTFDWYLCARRCPAVTR